MENHHFQWENPLWMVIFNSYVKLPEGTLRILKTWGFVAFMKIQLTSNWGIPLWWPSPGALVALAQRSLNKNAGRIHLTLQVCLARPQWRIAGCWWRDQGGMGGAEWNHGGTTNFSNAAMNSDMIRVCQFMSYPRWVVSENIIQQIVKFCPFLAN